MSISNGQNTTPETSLRDCVYNSNTFTHPEDIPGNKSGNRSTVNVPQRAQTRETQILKPDLRDNSNTISHAHACSKLVQSLLAHPEDTPGN